MVPGDACKADPRDAFAATDAVISAAIQRVGVDEHGIGTERALGQGSKPIGRPLVRFLRGGAMSVPPFFSLSGFGIGGRMLC
jgi:hypothetical protein